MKIIFTLFIFLLNVSFINAQTANSNLNKQLNELKEALLVQDFDLIFEFAYPKIYEKVGKQNLINAYKSEMEKIKEEGFVITEIGFDDASEFIKKDKELQFTITEYIYMQTPKGKILANYSLIGISNDNGLNWKFIDTSGKNKEIILAKFPNLSSELDIKAKKTVLLK